MFTSLLRLRIARSFSPFKSEVAPFITAEPEEETEADTEAEAEAEPLTRRGTRHRRCRPS
jgi:hypothetical protein